jgi:7-cyano-7-deazaguanine synthase
MVATSVASAGRVVSGLHFAMRDSQWQPMENPRPAAVLLSGGLDSATVLAIALSEGYQCHCLTVDYGQRHRIELEAARRVADELGAVSHRVVHIDLGAIGGSSLTDDIEVPKDRNLATAEIPSTYVPARNTVLLALLLGLAEVINAQDLFIGANAVDYSGYPDCRPEFLGAFETLARVATVAGAERGVHFRIHAPLLHLSKAEIIRRGAALGLDYSLTHSCYDPTIEGLACGRCDACVLRRRGFADADVPDPTHYAPH